MSADNDNSSLERRAKELARDEIVERRVSQLESEMITMVEAVFHGNGQPSMRQKLAEVENRIAEHAIILQAVEENRDVVTRIDMRLERVELHLDGVKDTKTKVYEWCIDKGLMIIILALIMVYLNLPLPGGDKL